VTETRSPSRPRAELNLGAGLHIPEGVDLPCTFNPDAWFPDSGYKPHFVRDRKDECAACPIRQACLEFAVAHPEIQHGIWGGFTARQIKRIRARRAGGNAA
jgi:hypothetical protein